MDEIATEGDVLTKFKAAGGSATSVPDSTQCVTKANLTNPAGLPSDMALNVTGTYDSNELVAGPDISFKHVTSGVRCTIYNLAYDWISVDIELYIDRPSGQGHMLALKSPDYYREYSLLYGPGDYKIKYMKCTLTNNTQDVLTVDIEQLQDWSTVLWSNDLLPSESKKLPLIHGNPDTIEVAKGELGDVRFEFTASIK